MIYKILYIHKSFKNIILERSKMKIYPFKFGSLRSWH